VTVACPFLPKPQRHYSWRDLAEFREQQGEELYERCLEYGQQLWLNHLPARALLAVDRALYCPMPAEAKILHLWPLPYRAIGWLVNQPTQQFTGNARVHYQHLADRVRGEQADLKKWRAWAAWAVVRKVRPDLPGDPRHAVREPPFEEILQGLKSFGLPNEPAWWQQAMDGIRDA
jgi:hypothetical protein